MQKHMRFHQFATITRKEVIRVLRIWTQTLLPSIISAILYFIVFGHLLGDRIGAIQGVPYIQFLAPGLVMMSMITNAYANACSSLFTEKFQRSIEEMAVSPMSPTLIIFGFLTGAVLRGLLVGLAVLSVAYAFTHLPIIHPVLLLFTMVLCCAFFALVGLVNGLFASNFDQVNFVPVFVLTPLTYLGGVFYSISRLPEPWQSLSMFNPIVHLINAMRYALLNMSDISDFTALLLLSTLTVLMFFLTHALFRRGYATRPV